jgi:hypothetical protein
MKQYEHVMTEAIDYAKSHATTPETQLPLAMDKLAVAFGSQIAKIGQLPVDAT